MLWKTLYNRIGRQPLTFTNHNHVYAIIDNKHIELDLKYDAHGRPYLIKAPLRKQKVKFAPGDKVRNISNNATGMILSPVDNTGFYRVKYDQQPAVMQSADELEKTP